VEVPFFFLLVCSDRTFSPATDCLCFPKDSPLERGPRWCCLLCSPSSGKNASLALVSNLLCIPMGCRPVSSPTFLVCFQPKFLRNSALFCPVSLKTCLEPFFPSVSFLLSYLTPELIHYFWFYSGHLIYQLPFFSPPFLPLSNARFLRLEVFHCFIFSRERAITTYSFLLHLGEASEVMGRAFAPSLNSAAREI